MQYSLYVVRNKINGKCYVGETKKYPLERLYGHITEAMKNRGYAFHSAIRRHGLQNFELIHTEHCEKSNVLSKEAELIKQYNSLQPYGYNILEFGQLSDMLEGWWKGKKRDPETVEKIAKVLREKYKGKGNPFYGKSHSIEVKAKIANLARERWETMPEADKREYCKKLSAAQTGRVVTEETKRKIGNANRGKKHTPEAIEKNRQRHLGKTHSEETKRKMSKAHMGRKKSEETKKNMARAQRAKIKPEQVERAKKIKRMLAEGFTGVAIAKEVNCTPEFVYKIKKGKNYGWL